MKAIIKATDLLFNKSVELECSIRKDVSASVELQRVGLANSKRIVHDLRLLFGEAKLELISYGRVIATGKMIHSVFTGRRPEIVPDQKAA